MTTSLRPRSATRSPSDFSKKRKGDLPEAARRSLDGTRKTTGVSSEHAARSKKLVEGVSLAASLWLPLVLSEKHRFRRLLRNARTSGERAPTAARRLRC